MNMAEQMRLKSMAAVMSQKDAVLSKVMKDIEQAAGRGARMIYTCGLNKDAGKILHKRLKNLGFKVQLLQNGGFQVSW